MNPQIEKMKGTIIKVLEKHGVRKAFVFGSYAHGDETPESDIDLLVEFEQRKSLLGHIKAENELSDKLGIKVDMLTEQAISPYLIDRIKNDMEVIYP